MRTKNMRIASGLLTCALVLTALPATSAESANAAGNKQELPTTLDAKSDAEIEAFVQKYKEAKFSELFFRIDWKKCTAKGFAALREIKDLKVISLSGGQEK